MNKYFIPTYISEEQMDNSIHIINNLNGAEIELIDDEIIDFNILRKNGTNIINSELEKLLYEQEYLISGDVQSELMDFYIDNMKSLLYLTIMPTEYCNFECIYCYEEHVNISMSEETINNLKIFLLNTIEKNKFNRIVIMWFGGEPTLRIDVIDEIMTYINKITKNQIPIDSFITTNGYTLNKDIFLKLYNLGVKNYQITFDGNNHDFKRPLRGGGKTSKVLLKNLIDISSIDDVKDFQITIRNNILAQDNDYLWYDFLKQHFGNDKRFNYTVITVAKFDDNELYEVEYSNELEKKHLAYMNKIGLSIIERVTKDIGSGICYAAYPNGYLIRANGDINKCTVDLDNKKNHIGMLTSNGIILNDNSLLWEKEIMLDKCKTCKHGLICMNRLCPLKNITNMEDNYLCI